MGAFGEINLDDVVLNVPKGTYKVNLTKAANHEASDQTDGRVYLILGFEVVESDDPDMIGESPEDVFITLWPELDSDMLRGFDSKTKKMYKLSVASYKDVARALGAEETDINNGEVDFEAFLGTQVYADIYVNKNEESRIQTKTMKNAYLVDNAIPE